MLELRNCLLIAEIATAGSLHQAAANLSSSTPVLSRRLASIEEACGGALFLRTGRGLRPSDLCEQLLPTIERLIDEARTLEMLVRDAGKETRGTVRIGILPAGSSNLLIALVTRLKQRYPGIRLLISDGSTGRLEAGLRNGTLDLAFCVRVNATHNEVERILTLNPLQLFAPPGFLPDEGETIDFRALADIPLILAQEQSAIRSALEQCASEMDMALTAAFEVDSLVFQLELLRAGLGCYIGPRGMVQPAGGRETDGAIVSRRIVNPGLTSSVVLARTPRNPLTRAGRVVMDMATAIAAELRESGVWHL